MYDLYDGCLFVYSALRQCAQKWSYYWQYMKNPPSKILSVILKQTALIFENN